MITHGLQSTDGGVMGDLSASAQLSTGRSGGLADKDAPDLRGGRALIRQGDASRQKQRQGRP